MPSSSDELLRLIRPASFYFARRSFDEVGQAMMWAGAAIAAMVIMLLLTAGGRAISAGTGAVGFAVGLFLMWVAIVGLVIHAARYLVAESAERLIERRYKRRAGRSSAKDMGLGQTVVPDDPRILLAITRSTDWDLAFQAIMAVWLTIVTR